MDKATLDDIYTLARRLNAQSMERAGDPRAIPIPEGPNGEWGVRLYLWGASSLDFLSLDECADWLTSQLV